MTLASGVTRFGQRQAEALMESTCQITRIPAGTTVDPVTGLEVTPAPVVVYSGKCRLRLPYVRPEQVLAADQQLVKERGILWLPIVGSEGVLAEDVATLTGNPSDAGSVGSTFVIRGTFAETHATSRRLPVESLA